MRFVVKRRIIHDDKAGFMQLWQEHFLNPNIHRVMRTTALKQHRCEPFVASLRHDKIDRFVVSAAHFSVNFCATFRPTMRAIALCLEPTFVKVL